MDREKKINIMLQIGVPTPESTREEKPQAVENKKPLEDKVREMLELVDSGHESAVEFMAVKKLYSTLCCKPKTPRVENLKKMIEPVLAKYGYHVGNREK